jgi:hypothetical protein
MNFGNSMNLKNKELQMSLNILSQKSLHNHPKYGKNGLKAGVIRHFFGALPPRQAG